MTLQFKVPPHWISTTGNQYERKLPADEKQPSGARLNRTDSAGTIHRHFSLPALTEYERYAESAYIDIRHVMEEVMRVAERRPNGTSTLSEGPRSDSEEWIECQKTLSQYRGSEYAPRD